MTTTTTATADFPNGFKSNNDAADFWYYKKGVNIIPANTQIKKANLIPTWVPWQTNSIPEDVFQGWKDEGLFELGMGIILGRVWRGEHEGDYIGGIDTDNAKAIQEVCTFKDQYRPLSEWANDVIIEQHADNPKKAHWIFYLDRLFANKSSDVNGPLADRLSSNEIPAIEVKGFAELLYVSPSVHKDGCRYEIIGTMVPKKFKAQVLEQHIDQICRKYGIKYLEDVDATGEHRKSQVPMDDLFQEDYVIYEGHNRHKAIMRVMESLIKNNRGILSEEALKHWARIWNDKHCKPPLDDKAFYGQWQDAKDFIARVKKAEEDRKRYYQKTAEEVDKMPLSEKIEYLLGSINMVHPKEMIERFHFKCMIDTRELYYYDDVKHAYVDNGGIIIEQELEANWLAMSKIYAKVGAIVASLSEQELENLEDSGMLGMHKEKSWSRGLIDDFQGHIERYPGVFMDRNKFNPDKEWMAFNNCMVNLLTKDISDFSPEFLNTTRIPVTYTGDVYASGPVVDFWNWAADPIISSGPCPKIRKFLYEIMAPEDVEMLLDYVAYCLWRDMPYHKWLILRGEGLNGKGTLLTLIRVFLGFENVSAESLTRLLENKWSTAQLYGKLANIDADISKEGLKNTGLLKKLSGNDPIPAENKFLKPFWFQNFAKLILSANEIPETPDDTDAFFRRPVITT